MKNQFHLIHKIAEVYQFSSLPSKIDYINFLKEINEVQLNHFIRLYRNYVHFFLLHETLVDLRNNFNTKSHILNLNCFTGIFGEWLKNYGFLNITNICINQWIQFNKKKVQNISLTEINHSKDNIVILTWPSKYDNNNLKILQDIKKDQILIYIGETKNGCCASDDFYHYIDNNFELQKIEINYLSLPCYNDKILVFKKMN